MFTDTFYKFLLIRLRAVVCHVYGYLLFAALLGDQVKAHGAENDDTFDNLLIV